MPPGRKSSHIPVQDMFPICFTKSCYVRALKERGGKNSSKEIKKVFIARLSIFVTFEYFSLTFKKRGNKKENYKRILGFCLPSSTHRFTLNLPSAPLHLPGTPGVVLIILLAGGEQTRVYGLPLCCNLGL